MPWGWPPPGSWRSCKRRPQRRRVVLRQGVASSPADVGKHLSSYPPLELLRRGELAGKDKGVQTALVNDGYFLGSAGGGQIDNPFIFLVNVLSNSLCSVSVAQHRCHILAHKPGFSVDFGDSELPGPSKRERSVKKWHLASPKNSSAKPQRTKNEQREMPVFGGV